MSFPSALKNLKAMGKTPETATEEEAREALFRAFETDVADGFAALARMAEEARASGGLVETNFPAGEKATREVIRLVGTDQARGILAERFGVHIGFANCHRVLMSVRAEDVRFSAARQIAWQATIDC